jgi:MtN3 and saliva related transmembrane protein
MAYFLPATKYSMDVAELAGYAAAVLSTVAFVPQVMHTWKSRDASGVSLGMVSVYCSGIALWLVYGVLHGAWPIIIANAITLALTLALLAMKIRFSRAALSPPR